MNLFWKLKRPTTSEYCILFIALSQPLKRLRVKDVARNWISKQLNKNGYFPVQVWKVKVGMGSSVHKAFFFFCSDWVKLPLVPLIEQALWGMWLIQIELCLLWIWVLAVACYSLYINKAQYYRGQPCMSFHRWLAHTVFRSYTCYVRIATHYEYFPDLAFWMR